MNESSNQARTWYREPWFWFVMSPLILVVVVSTFTVSIAIHSADDVVSDDYYKEGRMLAKESSSEDYAKSLGLTGQLNFDFISGEILLQLNRTMVAESVKLYISHPAKADLDQTYRLGNVVGGKYRVDMDAPLSGRWYLRLSAHENEKEVWRLHGEVDFKKTAQVILE